MSQVQRRQFLLALCAGGISVSLPTLAQQDKRVRRIGYFTGGSLQNNAAWLAAFREGMAALRWVEGRDYVIDARYGNGELQAWPRLAAELVATQPDLLLTVAESHVRQLTESTKVIPIVFTIAQDPVASGLAASLSYPGGSSTGLTTLAPELSTKRLQLLKEVFPRVAHIALLFDLKSQAIVADLKRINEVAPGMKLRITPFEVRSAEDIELAFKRGAALGVQAYMIGSGGLFNSQRQMIVDRLSRSKIPAMSQNSDPVEAGVLMSYGPSNSDNFRRAASYVDRIFKGAKPGDLPIEQPVKFELVVNTRTAKALGIKIPQSILIRADRVIE